MGHVKSIEIDMKFQKILNNKTINNKIKESILMLCDDFNRHLTFHKFRLLNKLLSDIEKISHIKDSINRNSFLIKCISDYMYSIDEFECSQESRDDIGSFKWLYKHIGDILFSKRQKRVRVLKDVKNKYRVYLENDDIEIIREILLNFIDKYNEVNSCQNSQNLTDSTINNIKISEKFEKEYKIPLPQNPPFLYNFFDCNGNFKSEPFVILADYFIDFLTKSTKINKYNGNAVAIRIFCLWLLSYYQLTIYCISAEEKDREERDNMLSNKEVASLKVMTSTEVSADRQKILNRIEKLAFSITSSLSSDQKFILASWLGDDKLLDKEISNTLGYGSQSKVTREKYRITKLLQESLARKDESGNKIMDLFEENDDGFLHEFFLEKLIEKCKIEISQA